MSVERINSESSADKAASSTQPETVVPFRMPLSKGAVVEGGEQKKSKHNRKRRKRELNKAAAEQSAPAKKSKTSEERNAYTIWQRPEDSPETRKSAELGKQVLGVTERPDNIQPAEETVQNSETVIQPKVEQFARKRQNRPERPILEWLEQPKIQHQGSGEVYEPVQPPPQPPDPMSYRRSFWKEQTPPPEAGQSDNGTVLPPLHDYERLAQELPYNSRQTSHVEAPAAVPSKNYESDVPPGYQRSTVDVSRAAWTGVLAGWWMGRRSKRQAVERAHKAGIRQGAASAKPQPMSERRRTVESSTPLAAIAVFDRIVNRPALERADVPRAAKAAAAKAAESVIIRAPETVAGAGSERQLDKRELMRLSKDIKIDGVSLKEVYKAQRIDEPGLRSVVDAYLRGGDVRQQLAEEIVAKEQSYELDPVLRHQYLRGERPQQSHSGTRSGSGGSAGGGGGVGQSIAHTVSNVATTTGQAARSASRAIASGAKTAQRDIIDNSNTADWLSVTAVVVLYSIILILLLT